MSIRINNKIISGVYANQSYRYVGEIFQSTLPINDSRVALLDGHKIYESEGYGSFIQYITSLALLYPQLACTEDEWQLSNTTYGECGKFVISEDGVRLPKIVSFVQGLSSLQDLATLVEAGLPNITGRVSDINMASVDGGAFYNKETKEYGYITSGNFSDVNPVYFDASLLNPTYGNSTTVQPQSIRYPYYIVLATGVTQEVKVKEELMTNNPFTLFESKYSEVELNNTSWLLSNGQWNSKELYPSAYNELLKEYNTDSNKYSIKLHTDEYGDYDFVLNLDDETFRLPLKSKLASGKAVAGNGVALGLTTGSANYGLASAVPSGNYVLQGKTSAYGTSAGTAISGSGMPGDTSFGITTDPTKSGIETSDSDLYLYFYVGDTNTNVSLVDTGKLTQEVANLIPNNSNLIAGYGMPTDRYINLVIGASGSTYTAPANGYVILALFVLNADGQIWLKSYSANMESRITARGGWAYTLTLPVRKGEIFKLEYQNSLSQGTFTFTYAQGEI